jgi:hypothetical protein
MGALTNQSTVYPNVTVLQGLIQNSLPDAYYIGKDASASGILKDYSGNARDLTGIGAPSYNDSPLVPCDPDGLYFRLPLGANKFSIVNPFTVPFNVDYSFSAIIAPLDFTTICHILQIGANDETAAGNVQIGARINTTGTLGNLWESGSGVDRNSDSGIAVPEGQAFLFSFVKDSTALTTTFYRNASKIASVAYTVEPTGGTVTNFGVGNALDATTTTGEFIGGHIAFWRGTKISQSFIAALARASGFF